MQKLGRVALFLLGGLIVVVVALLFGLNLYVQSQGTQARIEQEVRNRLGTPLTIQSISVTPWGGLKLGEISIPQTSGIGSSNLFEAKSLRLRVGLLSLFSDRLIIKQVSVLDAKVVWTQNAGGTWKLPSSPEAANRHLEPNQAVTSGAKTAGQSREQAVTGNESNPRSARAAAGETKAGRFVPEVRHIDLSRAYFRFLDRSGNLVAAFESVGFHSNLRGAADLHGVARVSKISLRDRFFLENLRSPLEYDGNRLVLSQVSAHSGGGNISGRFSIEPETKDSPFDVEVKFRNVEADRIVADAGGPPGVVQGKLEGSFQAAGKTAEANMLTGAGEIVLRDGQVKQYSLLVALGQVFQIEELTQLHLEQAQAKYHITPGLVNVDDLTLRSPNIHLSARGTVTFGGKLHLDSRLAINEKIRSQLFKPIRANFQPTDEPGYSAVEFEVGGTIDRPKTNLLEKVVGRDLKDLVNSLWGGKTPRPKKKQAEGGPQETAASPSSSATPPTAAVPTPAGSP